MDADTDAGIDFVDDAERLRDKSLTDFNEQNHMFFDPGTIRGRNVLSSLTDYVSWLLE